MNHVNKTNLISQLFLERSKFVLIGLTGRTGSGCTTAAGILESITPKFPNSDFITQGGNPFYSNLDAKRYEILKNYSQENWTPFYAIKVSDLISAYILNLDCEQAADFICASANSIELDRSEVYSKLTSGIFSTNKIKSKFARLIDAITNHETDLDANLNLDKFRQLLLLVRGFTAKFKEELKSLDDKLYIAVYQAAGDSIRTAGKVVCGYKNQTFSPEKVFHLPETINRVVKLIRKISKDQAFIVIDAIRNPYEARFFRERYAAFYLVSINAPDEDRKNYLQNVHKFTVDQLKNLESKESGEVEKDNQKNNSSEALGNEFRNQNVKRCIEISDIHIFNPRNEIQNNNVLKAQLAWYIALMMHPGLVTPTAMERIMQIAYTAKSNSGCISRQVGAAITDDENSIKAIGWNDVAKGQVPCSLRSLNQLTESFNEVTFSTYERNNADFRAKAVMQLTAYTPLRNELKGRNLSYCFKDIKNSIDEKANQVHTRSLHAEENAFLQLAKYGGPGIKGGKLFTTASPCELCAKKAYQLGIAEIIFIDPYPGIAREHILSIGSNPPKLVQFRGAVGKGYHQLYEQTLPYKDELSHFRA